MEKEKKQSIRKIGISVSNLKKQTDELIYSSKSVHAKSFTYNTNGSLVKIRPIDPSKLRYPKRLAFEVSKKKMVEKRDSFLQAQRKIQLRLREEERRKREQLILNQIQENDEFKEDSNRIKKITTPAVEKLFGEFITTVEDIKVNIKIFDLC
jgi:hypothetical protein